MSGSEVRVLGATGRTGSQVAARLRAAGVPLVLVGRDRARLAEVAARVGGTPRIVAGALDAALAELRAAEPSPAVVVNAVGPFTRTAAQVVDALPPGTHYVDVANELEAVQAVLDRDAEAVAAGRTLVAGAGFGVLATEAVVVALRAQGEGVPAEVRVDAIASVATEPGRVGAALAGSIVDGLRAGNVEVHGGRLVTAPAGGAPTTLTTPDGDVVVTASASTGELLAAWRASGADEVVAASAFAPRGAMVRVVPLAVALARVPGVARLIAAGAARVPLRAAERPRASSWAHARIAWPSGAVREGWLRAGDGMDLTASAAAEVARRLAAGEGRPGAWTPAALFGAQLAEAAGAELRL